MADRLKRLERKLGLAAAPSPFAIDPKTICRRVEATLSAEETERKQYMKHKIRLAAVLTAAALALTTTAWAVGPTLDEILQAALGVYAPYAKTMEGTVEDQGIQVRLVSALADSTHVKVYFELTDLTGQGRLALVDPDMMYSQLELDLPEDQMREGAGYSWGIRRLGYDPDAQTLLTVLERNNGVLLPDGPTGELRIGRLTRQRISFFSDEPVPMEKLTGSYLATQELASGETVLVPGQSNIDLPGAQGVTLSSMGFSADGRLHFLFCFPSGSTQDLCYGTVSVYHNSGELYAVCEPTAHFTQDGVCYYDFSILATPEDLGDLVFSKAYGIFGSDAEDIEGEWVIPLTLKQVEERSIPLTGAIGPVELKELRLSSLGVTVVTQAASNDRIDGYPMRVFLSDGAKAPLDRGQTGSGGYGGPDLNRWNFAEPIEDLNSVTGVSIGYWMIPIENGTAGEGYWLSELPE